MEDRTDLRLEGEGDAKITEALRGIYAPPAEGAYWDTLETRIMANIRAHRQALIPAISAARLRLTSLARYISKAASKRYSGLLAKNVPRASCSAAALFSKRPDRTVASNSCSKSVPGCLLTPNVIGDRENEQTE